MSAEKFTLQGVSYVPVLASFLISVITVIVNWRISVHTINTNRQLNRENAEMNARNAGKNRVIYGVEEIAVDDRGARQLNEKLSTEAYAILAVSLDHGNSSRRIYSLGKINKEAN